MSDEKRELLFSDVSIALEIVGLLLGQLTIPASRAQEFAVTGAVIADLKAFVDSKIKATTEGQEGAPVAEGPTSEAPSEQAPDTEEA